MTGYYCEIVRLKYNIKSQTYDTCVTAAAIWRMHVSANMSFCTVMNFKGWIHTTYVLTGNVSCWFLFRLSCNNQVRAKLFKKMLNLWKWILLWNKAQNITVRNQETLNKCKFDVKCVLCWNTSFNLWWFTKSTKLIVIKRNNKLIILYLNEFVTNDINYEVKWM